MKLNISAVVTILIALKEELQHSALVPHWRHVEQYFLSDMCRLAHFSAVDSTLIPFSLIVWPPSPVIFMFPPPTQKDGHLTWNKPQRAQIFVTAIHQSISPPLEESWHCRINSIRYLTDYLLKKQEYCT